MFLVNKTFVILSVAAFALTATLAAQTPAPQPEPLWGSLPVPLAQGTGDLDTPQITAYVPKEGTGVGVVICPGGSYRALALDHEGKQIADWLNARGVAAFVLKYRLGPRYHHPVMLTDVQRALRLVRSRAAQYNLKPDHIGIWGFSAGGHLASTASVHYAIPTAPADDPTKDVSARPDFSILAYPVISGDPAIWHKGSFTALLGDNPDPQLLDLMSNEKHVTRDTPPTFLFHTTDDAVVPVLNSVRYYAALIEHGVKQSELHIYQHGRHGVGLDLNDPLLGTWPDHLADWLIQFGVPRR